MFVRAKFCGGRVLRGRDRGGGGGGGGEEDPPPPPPRGWSDF